MRAYCQSLRESLKRFKFLSANPAKDTMEKFVTITKRKAERDGGNKTNESLPKAKTRKYDESFLALGFTVTIAGDEESLLVCCV